MSNKIIVLKEEARNKLYSGVFKLAEAVVTTLGPKGRNVALDKKWSAPSIVHDGVTVAKAIELKDPFENMGAELVKEAANKTADRAGDGTTTSILLAQSMVKEGLTALNNGINPMVMKKGIELATNACTSELEKISKPLETSEQVAQVATISSADNEIGKMISQAMDKVTKNGVIFVEEGSSFSTTVEYKEGVEFDHGYYSHQFVTDEEHQVAEIDNPYILLTDLKLDNPIELIDWISGTLTREEKDLVLVVDTLENNVLPTLVRNKEKGALRVLVIEAPGFGIKRRWLLEDMAVLTGGKFISKEASRTLSSVTKEELGIAEKVWSDLDRTKIIGGQGSAESIKERVVSLKNQLPQLDSDFEKKQINDRIAKLSGGVAVIKVGAQTEVEMKEKKERIIDAVEATKSAVEEGIVAGGGTIQFHLSDLLSTLKNDDIDIQAGIDVVKVALQQPFVKLMENAGIIERLNPHDDFGTNVETGKVVNMFDEGIIDPTKVTRQSLQNASSVSAMILTTDVLITDDPDQTQTMTQ